MRDEMRTLVLEGDLGLRDAPDLAGALAAALADGDAALDAAPLLSVDAPILQVLIAGHRSATEAGRRFGFTDPGQPVLRAALVAHGMLAEDGSALTPDHPFWTRVVTPEGETA